MFGRFSATRSFGSASSSSRTFLTVARGNGNLGSQVIADRGSLLLGSSGQQSGQPNLLHSSFFQQVRSFIQMRTVLKVADNSGAKKVMCIQSLDGKKGARLGDLIVVSVKEAMPNGKAKKGSVHHAVVVRAAMQRGRCDGSEIKFDDNACVLLDKKNHEPIGTRVFGPVPHELRKRKHIKILTLAQHIA
ncbi:hypothetical protein MLD38_037177 [Melastoma candidum]|uniref:Uncharacterized protein n=1 Tax=Melastoma candidum TaxID=119954 RepID=A0ACB9LLY1_9MYRT|nr:hypothetical protein MLD38_037177 [Melastoma candidum]